MYRVKFPMAFPLIMTGVKTAMIEIVASAALAAKIGAGGLGGLIFTGLGLNRLDLLLVGESLWHCCLLYQERFWTGSRK